MDFYRRRRRLRFLAVGTALLLIAAISAAVWFFLSLRAPHAAQPDAQSGPIEFRIASSTGVGVIAQDLAAAGIIRSPGAFQVYAALAGHARGFQPGRYRIAPGISAAGVSETLAAGPEIEAVVTVPEGFTAADIDSLLVRAGVTQSGEFLALAREGGLEGRLFPDTYRFYFNSRPQQVLDRFLSEFERQAAPLLKADPENIERNLVLASLLEKEVPDYEERRIVAGLLLKRAAAGMPLQVDATICYIKEVLRPEEPCEPIRTLDKEIDSPYNTYLNSGWPPGAISNPGVLAIKAALDPVDSLYWYYLSDPDTGKTIFAETLDEHLANQLKYLN